MQSVVLYVSLAGMLAIALCFVSAVRASGTQKPPARNRERLRGALFWLLLVSGAVISVASLWHWPHAVAAGPNGITVNVTGAQWYWEIDRNTVPAGRPVVFNVHARDVNHGMGIVDQSGLLILQTQGMPGYVNQVSYVFDRPGKYRVICLEFCGVAHHDMIDELTVTEANAEGGAS